MFDAHSPPDATSLLSGHSHIRATEDGTTYVKVVGLPPPAGTFEPEAVWVRIVEGDPLKGHGIVDNRPIFCKEVGYGDQIEWDSVDENHLPFYVGIDAPAAELVPLAPPPSAAPAVAGRAVAGRAPAAPVKGSRYSTRYGQWFEFDGGNWNAISTPEESAPVPAPVAAPTSVAPRSVGPIPTPTPTPTLRQLPPGVVPGPSGGAMPARYAETGHPGLPKVEQKTVRVPTRMMGQQVVSRPVIAPSGSSTSFPARIGRRRSQVSGAVPRPAAAASGPVRVPSRVAAEQSRAGAAADLAKRQAEAAAKRQAAAAAAAAAKTVADQAAAAAAQVAAAEAEASAAAEAVAAVEVEAAAEAAAAEAAEAEAADSDDNDDEVTGEEDGDNDGGVDAGDEA